MSGDANKVSVLANADVLRADIGSTIPDPGDDFDGSWELVGLLGTDGLKQARSRDASDKYALGGILVATTRKNFKQELTFTVLEESEVTDKLIWPGSARTFDGADYSGRLKVPDPTARHLIALVVRSGDSEKRLITANYAQVDDVGELVENDDDLWSREVKMSIYPDADNYIFDTSKMGANPLPDSIDVLPATTTKAVAATQQLAVTATFPDTTDEVVTEFCTYISSAPSKATVDQHGLITAVATGSATITATYRGQTDTCVVTVS